LQQILKKHLKVDLKPDVIYSTCEGTPEFEQIMRETSGDQPEKEGELEQLLGLGKIVWTRSMKRLYTLVGRCLQHKVLCGSYLIDL
jgi:midasin